MAERSICRQSVRCTLLPCRLHEKSRRVSGFLPRRWAAPGRSEIGRGQRILGILVGHSAFRSRFDNMSGIAARRIFPLHAFSHELVQHPRSRLGSGAQLTCDMRTDGAGVGLAGAELAKVTHGRGGGRNRVRRADLASFRLARRATRQQDENKPEPKRHAQKKKHDTQFPCGRSHRSRKFSRQP